MGSLEFVGKTGADLAGFRSFERDFAKALSGEAFGVERTAGSAMGIDQAYFGRMFGSIKLNDMVPELKMLIKEQSTSYDKNGWMHEKHLIEGTPAEYMDGKEMDVIVCPNQRSKDRFKKLVEDDEGEWIGLEFHLKSEEPEKDADYMSLIDAWLIADYVDMPCATMGLTDWNDIVEVDQPRKEEEPGIEVMSKRVLQELPKNFNQLHPRERISMYWGGGSPPISARAADSIARKCFPKEDLEYPVGEFLKIVRSGLVDVWGFENYRKEMGDVELDSLVVGQILQRKGQIVVDYGNRTLKYVPRPAAYKASQQRAITTD